MKKTSLLIVNIYLKDIFLLDCIIYQLILRPYFAVELFTVFKYKKVKSEFNEAI